MGGGNVKKQYFYSKRKLAKKKSSTFLNAVSGQSKYNIT